MLTFSLSFLIEKIVLNILNHKYLYSKLYFLLLNNSFYKTKEASSWLENI